MVSKSVKIINYDYETNQNNFYNALKIMFEKPSSRLKYTHNNELMPYIGYGDMN